MSILYAFDSESEEILKPCYAAPPVEGFPETVIVNFLEDRTRLARDLFQGEVVSHLHASSVVPVYRIGYQGHELGVCTSSIGGPAAAGFAEELFAKGAKRLLLYGACGVLTPEIAARKLIIPVAAYRDEGTSYHYLPVGDYVDIPTAGRLCEIFDELRLPYVQGRTWTTDAIYRETRKNMEARRREGCIVVEMECASVMAVGQFRKKEVYQFLFAEDSLAGDVWDPRTLNDEPPSEEEKFLRVALEAAIRLEGDKR